VIRAGLAAVLVVSGISGDTGLLAERQQARVTTGAQTIFQNPAQVSNAQADVRAYVRPETVSAGGRVVLIVEVVPKARMHVYAPGAAGYRAAALTVVPQRGLQIGPTRYPRSEPYLFQPLNERVPVFQTAFVLTREVGIGLRAARGAERLTIAGAFEYQACDDKVCYNPVSVPLEWTLRLAAPVPSRRPATRGAATP
jgi:hypothetical protein